MPKELSEDVVPFGESSLEGKSFTDLMNEGVVDIAEIDDTTIVNQADLVGIPFILTGWEMKDSLTYGGEYAIVRVSTQNGNCVFTDGGTGIKRQLEGYKNRLMDKGLDAFAPMYFHFGLRASHYNKEIDGKTVAATTFYFDNRRRP